MNSNRHIIETFRKTQNTDLLENLRCVHNGKEGYGFSDDKNYKQRKAFILELYKDYSAKDKPLIKWLIQEELKGFEFDIPVYTTDLCAFMLYKHMETEDVYDLFKAKFGVGSDHQGFLDIELVFGLDAEVTKDFLIHETNQKELNQEILEVMDWYLSHPDIIFKSRTEYIHYFETNKINKIKFDLEDC